MSLAENWKKIVVGAVIVFTLLILGIGFLVGLKGLKDFFTFVIIGMLVICILFGIGYVIYLIFIQKNYKDIPAQFRKKLFSVTKVMDNNVLGRLFLSGDSKHNRISLGKYFYLRINLPKIIQDNVKDVKDATDTDIIQIDCFIIQKEGFINKLFSEPFFILVRPEDHDYSRIFNDVTINGFNLVPLDSEFFTINTRNLDLDLVKGLSLNYIKECVFDVFKDLDRLVKQSINLDQNFQKDKEKSREFEIPQISNFGKGGS